MQSVSVIIYHRVTKSDEVTIPVIIFLEEIVSETVKPTWMVTVYRMQSHEDTCWSIVLYIGSMFGDPHMLYLKHQVSGDQHRLA